MMKSKRVSTEQHERAMLLARQLQAKEYELVSRKPGAKPIKDSCDWELEVVEETVWLGFWCKKMLRHVPLVSCDWQVTEAERQYVELTAELKRSDDDAKGIRYQLHDECQKQVKLQI